MKRLSDIAPGISVIAAAVCATILFYAGEIVSAHDVGDISHPQITKKVSDVEADYAIVILKIKQSKTISELIQSQNKADHERIFSALERISEKIDKL